MLQPKEKGVPEAHKSEYTRTANDNCPPPCDIPSGCCFFTGPWTVTRSSLRMLRRVAAFCRPLRPLLLLVSFPRSRSPQAPRLPQGPTTHTGAPLGGMLDILQVFICAQVNTASGPFWGEGGLCSPS